MRQTRYAVVLNGGVSLAIWMGGVTHELNRLRFASDAPGATNTAAWEAILAKCQRRVSIDILAGTSAGGLNGTLLATAVARGADLPPMRDVWCGVASLAVGALTRADVAMADSVLDGNFFDQQVTSIIGGIQPNGVMAPRECTLLVTSTALDSPPLPTPLETGNVMFSRDGRRVFKFERRIGPASQGSAVTDDFCDGIGAEALSRAARASASYPVAFAPVWETDPLGQRAGISSSANRWLADGGVLDNAPFEPLLTVLRDRPINEPFERVLLYVTPGAGRGDDNPPPLEPPNLRTVLGLVMSAMREPDERLDADALELVFRQMSYARSQTYRTIWDYLGAPAEANLPPLLEAATALFDGYRTTRAEATERWLGTLAGGRRPGVLAPPLEATLEPGEIPGIPRDAFPNFDGTTWHWGWSAADRILRWWGRAMSKLDLDTLESAKAMEAIAAAQREVTARWNELQEAVIGDMANPLDFSQQLEAMQELYDGGLTGALTAAMLPTAEAIATAVEGVEAQTLIKLSLAIEVVSGIFAWAGGPYDSPTFRFHNVTPAVPGPPGIGLGPIDQQPDWPTKKLYGERLNHFGAFASEPGRRHDWLWGRLDGASELSRQLLAAAGIPDAQAQPLREALIKEVLASEGISVEDVVQDAYDVYNTDANDMLRAMADTDGGRAFRQLEATVWELTRQFGVPGAWLRALLAPTWQPRPDDNIGMARSMLMRSIRAVTSPLRSHFRKKLPYR